MSPFQLILSVSGVVVKYMRFSRFDQGCPGDLALGERINARGSGELAGLGLLSLLCSGISVCCLPQDMVTEHWLFWEACTPRCRDGAEPGA